MASLTIENYVKAIYQLTTAQVEGARPSRTASTGALSVALQVAPSSVTSMLKTLHESGLADHRPYEGARLTEQGRRLALRVLRRHRLIELFLVQTLQLSWDEVHEEAEHMEHAVSDLLVDRIDEFLQFPELDPHGDPIPRSDGTIATSRQTPLSECATGSQVILQRVLDQSSEFLRFLTEGSFEIGVPVKVICNDQAAGTVTVMTMAEHSSGQPSGQREVVFGRDAASRLMMCDESMYVPKNTSSPARRDTERSGFPSASGEGANEQ